MVGALQRQERMVEGAAEEHSGPEEEAGSRSLHTRRLPPSGAAKRIVTVRLVGDEYIPALRFRSLTRLYDPLLAAFLRERTWKTRLVEQAALQPGMRVLDLGCGTGTLTLLLVRARPDVRVVGLDADPEILARAREKARQAGLQIEFVQAMADEPPFPDGSFDRVVSSLFFHHLTSNGKRRTLAAVRRLLRPGGELHVADWGRAQDPLMRAAFLFVQLLDGFESTADNVRGHLAVLVEAAGFGSVAETDRLRTVLGTLSLLRATAD
jgi:SAM-dependent methyltransferase